MDSEAEVERSVLLARERDAREEAETLNEVSRVLAAELDLQKVLQSATDASTKLTGAKFGAFFYNVTNEQGEAYLLYTLSGAPREAFEKFGVPRATALFAPTFHGSGPVRIADVLTDSRYGKNPPHHGMPRGHLPVRSYLAVPVIARSGEVLGGLFFGHPDPRIFTERAERIASGIAAQAAIAIDNARLFAGAEREIRERKQVEEALRESEARWRTTLQSIGDAVISTDAEGCISFMNPVAENITGWSQSEVRGLPLTSFFKLTNEFTRKPVENPVGKVLREGVVVGLANHTVLTAKDGKEIPIDDSAAPIFDPNGRLKGVVFVFRDITERRAAELSANRLAAIVESSEDAIVGKDLRGTVTSWNRGAERIFGYSAEEMVGKQITRLFPPDRLGEEQDILARLQRGERVEHFETVRITKAGKPIDVEVTISPIRDAEGHILGASKIAREITERKRTQEALRESEERYRTLFSSIDEGFCTIEVIFNEHQRPIDYRFLELNPAFEKQTGIKNAEGKRMRELAPRHEQHWFDTYGQVALTGKPAKFENYAEALHRYFEVFAFRIGAPERRRVGVIFRDITERRRREEQLQEAVQERTRELRSTISELEAFAYSLSHDMRAPLRAIQSYSQMVLDDYPEQVPQTAQEYLTKVVGASARMDRLIQDVLAFSRLSRQEIKLEPVDVEKLIRDLIQERPEFHPARANIRIESPLLPVLGHDASLTQCITNLLSNAVKFVRPGETPQIRIWSECIPPSNGTVRARSGNRESEWVRLYFEDQGIGIEKEAQQRLFGMFQRLHRAEEYQGTGIGLAIVRKAVERMGGQAGLESEPGKGSRFWLQLQKTES